MDRFDEVFSVLTEDQGWSEENARKIMVYCVEQGMNPIEAAARFIGGMGGLPTVDLRKPFFNPWNMFPKKPQPQQGLPKTGPSSPLPTQKALPPAKPIPTPKQTQGMLGSRSVPNIQQVSTKYGLDTPAPKPQFGPGSTKPIGPNPARNIFDLPRPDAGIKARNALNTPKPSAPTARGGGSPISAVVSALTDLQGSTPQSGPAADRARANRETAIQAKWGQAMNQTPSRFGKAGPDVPATPAAKPAPKPAAPVAAKPKPAPVERTKAKLQPEVKRPEPPKPVDPRLQKYRELIKQGRHETARNLGMRIHADTRGIPTTPTRKTA